MKANTLETSERTTSKRLGRGNGSGKGTYSSRGMKGQKARTGKKLRPGFEGGQTPLIQRMPKKRGFKNPNKVVYQPVNLSDLNDFDAGKTITVSMLAEKKLVNKKGAPVKLLGFGEIDKKVTVEVHAASKSAISKIEKAGGSLTIIE